jgi:hypothetical protein
MSPDPAPARVHAAVARRRVALVALFGAGGIAYFRVAPSALRVADPSTP